jgi:hypothetical protein
MKKEDIPQDKSALGDNFPELCYAKNDNGGYDTVKSSGWEIKATALDLAWENIHDRIDKAKSLVEKGKKSPIYFHMEKNLMTIPILASYVKYCPFRVWWHMRPSAYKKLNSKVLQKYALVFNISIEELNTIN